jgi:hypothetical protein
MPTLKYKDSDGNYQSLVGLNVQNQVVQTTGQSTTAVMSQKAVSDLVPAQASPSNQLADKNFVNSSISTATATYQGSYNLVSDLSLTTQASHGQIEDALGTAISGADSNDYSYVQIPTSDSTPTEIASVERYKFNGTRWSFEYALNNSGFTAAQWAAVNSGITSGLVAKLGQLTSNPQNSIAALFGMDSNGDWQNITPANLASVLSAAGIACLTRSGHFSIDGNFTELYSALKNNTFIPVFIGEPNTYGAVNFPNGVNIGDSCFIFKWDDNAGARFVISRTLNKIWLSSNVFGWSEWKEL